MSRSFQALRKFKNEPGGRFVARWSGRCAGACIGWWVGEQINKYLTKRRDAEFIQWLKLRKEKREPKFAQMLKDSNEKSGEKTCPHRLLKKSAVAESKQG